MSLSSEVFNTAFMTVQRAHRAFSPLLSFYVENPAKAHAARRKIFISPREKESGEKNERGRERENEREREDREKVKGEGEK